jgi:hypothetical protein
MNAKKKVCMMDVIFAWHQAFNSRIVERVSIEHEICVCLMAGAVLYLKKNEEGGSSLASTK